MPTTVAVGALRASAREVQLETRIARPWQSFGAAQVPQRAENTPAVAFADVDGDGDLDVVLGNAAESVGSGQNRLYLNDGTGRFVDATAGRLPVENENTEAVRLADVDGDGDQDLFCANSSNVGGDAVSKLYINDGSGAFTEDTLNRADLAHQASLDAQFFDADGDGALELVCARAGQDLLLFNDGGGRFTLATRSRLPRAAWIGRELATADVDGDGDADLVVTSQSRPTRLLLGDGRGRFDDATASHLPGAVGNLPAAAFGDVDRDGDPDLVLARIAGTNRLHLNDGTGRFVDATASHMPADSDRSAGVVLVDVDHDGDLDAVFANVDTTARLYLNDGTGTFSDATLGRIPTTATHMEAVAAADLDGSGGSDLVLVGRNTIGRLLRGDGRGVFADTTARQWPEAPTRGTTLALLDFDRDGDLDVFVGRDGTQDLFFVNTVLGFILNRPALPVDRAESIDSAVGDVDADGWLDLVITNGRSNAPSTVRLYRNTGDSRFEDATAERLPPATDAVNAALLVDVDRDDDLDLALLGTREDRVLPNRLVQLDAPFLPAVGDRLTLEIATRVGAAPLFQIAIPLLAARSANLPLPPFGTIGIDLATAALLPPVYVPPGTGSVALDLPVPIDPALRGSVLYAQAVVLAPLGDLRLTNALSTTIR